MLEFGPNYPDQISFDGKILYVNRGKTLTKFIIAVIVNALMIGVYIYIPFHFSIFSKLQGIIAYVLIICWNSDLLRLVLDTIFVNEMYINYEEKKIIFINIFQKKTIHCYDDVEAIDFYKRKFFSRYELACYYKIILKFKDQKYVIISDLKYKNDAINIINFLKQTIK